MKIIKKNEKLVTQPSLGLIKLQSKWKCITLKTCHTIIWQYLPEFADVFDCNRHDHLPGCKNEEQDWFLSSVFVKIKKYIWERSSSRGKLLHYIILYIPTHTNNWTIVADEI